MSLMWTQRSGAGHVLGRGLRAALMARMVAGRQATSDARHLDMTKCPRSTPRGSRRVPVKSAVPPGPKSLPLIGTLYKYLPVIGSYKINDRQTADTRRCKAYGSVVREEVFPGQVMYYIYDPKLFPQVFRQEPKYPFRFEMSGVKAYRESRGHHPGFPNAKGEYWNKIRQPTNKLTMSPQAVRAYIDRQKDVARDMVDLLRMRRDSRGEVDNLLDIFYRWAMESIGVVIFDTRLGTLSPDVKPGSGAHKFVEAANDAFETMYDTTFFWPLHQSKRTKTWRRLCASFDYIAELSQTQIDACLKRSEEGSNDELNFLQTLSLTPNLSKDEVLSIICDLFYGSVDTACHSLNFILYHLAKNPDVQSTLLDEIRQHASSGTELTGSVMDDMKYLKAVVKESHRLTPVSAFGVARTFDKDIEVDGYTIEAGSTVFLQPNVAAVSEEYFEDPRAFKPDRWLRSNTREHSNSFPMLSFGFGARMCPGKRFAEQEMYIALIDILQQFQLKYDYEDMKMMTRFTNQPDRPLRISFENRIIT